MIRKALAIIVAAGLPLAASAQVEQTAETALQAAIASGVCAGTPISARWEAGRVIATCRAVGLGQGAAPAGALGAGVLVVAVLAGGGSSTTTTTSP